MIGKTLLHYEVASVLGKGGMGEVYRARDAKLGRDVALKILPAELSGDPEREARFQREARALASLQHANVASVYGFEEADGVRFLVMEYVDGAELTERMGQGPLTVDETRAVARQMAAGLEAAHETGIVHRDLKPANVMETAEGEVKILDFGLAQAWFGDDPARQESATSPTITAAMTQAGAILGTAAYMSPEQARGQAVDRRADIWAFGVILYEMLVGKQLFKGETTSDTLAAVLRAEPDWEALPVDEAPELCRLIERCLERDPKQRLRDIGEARIFLQDGGSSSTLLNYRRPDVGAAEAAPSRARIPVPLLAGLAVLCLAAGAALGWKVLASPEPAPLLHTMIPAPKNAEFDLNTAQPSPAVISPDGTQITFAAVDQEGVSRLYLRLLDQGESIALSGTEGAAYPFWSPDSRFIGFFHPGESKLKKVAATGGPPVTLCAAGNGKGGAWNADGVILFAPDHASGIQRVADIGGEPVELTRPGPEHDSHRHPRFLPDGEHFVFTARVTSGDMNDVYLASLDTTLAPRPIAQTQAHADYADGHLMLVREGVLMAAPFTPDQERLVAGAKPLVEDVMSLPGAMVGVFKASETGMMVYQTGISSRAGQIVAWVDADNGGAEPLGEPGQVFHPFISPDGSQAVVEMRNASTEGTDLWLMDLETGLRTRFTFAAGDERWPCWSRDGESVFYVSIAEGRHRILQQPVEGRGGAAIVFESDRQAAPTDVTADGRHLLIDFERDDGNFEIRRLDLEATGEEALTVLATRPDANVAGGEFSPDDRWIAYHAESAAGWDVFVIPAEGGVRKWQVTVDGAVYPKWSSDGAELWVSRFNGDLNVYEVDGTTATFRVGDFTRPLAVSSPGADGCSYDLHPDGERLLHSSIDPAFRSEVSHLHLVTDWRRGLAR